MGSATDLRRLRVQIQMVNRFFFSKINTYFFKKKSALIVLLLGIQSTHQNETSAKLDACHLELDYGDC